MNGSEVGLSSSANEKDFLYSVLNLPSSASEHEIRERYRGLSIIFHPDKQHGSVESKATAERRFLEIQKAYEVLSDSFLREVYNIFGKEGLDLQWPDSLRDKSPEELRTILRRTKLEADQQKLQDEIKSRGRFTCGIDASPLFNNFDDPPGAKLHRRLLHRLKGTRVLNTNLTHDIVHAFNDNTRIRLLARVSTAMDQESGTLVGGNSVMGTIRHQYNPRWTFQATTPLLRPGNVGLKAMFRDDETACLFQTHLSLMHLRALAPPLTISVSRRLFRQSQTEAALTVNTGPSPSLSISLLSPSGFDAYPESYGKPAQFRPGSESGFSSGTLFNSYTLILAGISSGLEYGIVTGLACMLTGAWAHGRSEVATAVGLNQFGVMFRLDLTYVGQRMSIPIVLSQEHDMSLAFWTAVIPSTAFVLGYRFFLKPRRHKERLAFFQAARKAMEDEKSHTRREFEETIALLKETAKKHMQLESSKQGLVILEAQYGPADQDENTRELILDVTVPLQALVHHSQLYIPGHRPKSGVQGFYDPAPGCPKAMRVRYSFRGRDHYAEIPDYMPVVLPLADHIVE